MESMVVIGLLVFFAKGRAPEKKKYTLTYDYENLDPETGELDEVRFTPNPIRKKKDTVSAK